MQFEYAFSKAGGLFLAGFTPLEAIDVATANGAPFSGESDRMGTMGPGGQADLTLTQGDPSRKIEDVANIEIVLQNGSGYLSAKRMDPLRGLVGSR